MDLGIRVGCFTMVLECAGTPEIRHIFIDLDETLYSNPVVVDSMTREIERFMWQKLGLSSEEAKRLPHEYHEKYGTAIAGLVAEGHSFNPEEYQRDVHALDYEALIQPQPALKKMLLQIEQPKYIFTNGDHEHAERCLRSMDMENGIICYNSLQESAIAAGMDVTCRVVCKPHPDAFHLAMHSVGACPATSLFIDDSLKNCFAAKELGMQTLLVHSTHLETSLPLASSLMELPRFYPLLFRARTESTAPSHIVWQNS